MNDVDEDEVPETPPARSRLKGLLVVLAVAAVTSGVVLWYVFRPRPVEPPPAYRPSSLLAAEREAKKLPENAELRAMTRKPLTDTEAARALELARHANVWIRIQAIDRLAGAGDGPHRGAAVDVAVAALRDEEFSVRCAGLNALAGMNARDRADDVRALLASPDNSERHNARQALKRMGLPTE